MVDDIREPRRPEAPEHDHSSEESEEALFMPPEEVARDEEVIDMAALDTKPPETEPSAAEKPDKKKSDKKPSRIKLWLGDVKYWWQERSKKQKIILSIAGVLLIAALGVGGFLLFHHPKPVQRAAPVVQKKEAVKVAPKPTTEASNLTGVQVPPEYNLLPVTGVMIENSPDARPQSGLKDAGVVFEAVAEGGITRFLTLFQEAQPDYVGPVRSVRPYYLSYLEGFDAAVAHVGGSPAGIAKLHADGVKDLDQFYNGGAYQRITQRYAPHNVYTSLGGLLALEKTKGWTSSTFTGFARKTDKPLATPTAKSINLTISGPLYDVHYDYDVTTNSYKRSEGGQPHTDERSGLQLSPKVVVALVLNQSIDPDGIHTDYGTIGSGTAFFFQDGGVVQGTWSKASDKEQLHFGNANGSPLALNAGQTWVTLVGAAGNVTYTP